MGAIQELDATPMQPWTGVGRRRGPRAGASLAAAVGAGVSIVALGWWTLVHGIPEHQIRATSAAVRQVELPADFDPAPLACDGAGLLCAWTDLEPAAAAAAVREAVAEKSVGLPEARCGPGTPAPFSKYGLVGETAVQGVCIASSERSGVQLTLVANDEVPIGPREAELGSLPRTLVTLGWFYDARDRTVPGSPAFGEHEILLFADELLALPGPLGELTCEAGEAACLSARSVTTSDVLGSDDYWALVDELAASGIRLDSAFCADGICNSSGVMARPARPGETLLVIVEFEERAVGGSLEMSVLTSN